MAAKFPLSVVISAVDKISAPLSKVSGTLGKFGAKASQWGKTMSIGVTAPLVAAGGAALMVGANFERSMTRLKSLTKGSEAEMEALANQARELGESSGYGLRAVAALQVGLGKEGKNAQEILAATPKLLNLARIADVQLEDALQATEQVLNSFSLGAERTGEATQFLAAMAARSGVGLDDVQAAMVQIGPLAERNGLSLEQVGGALAALDDAGIKAKKGGGALVTLLEKLREPSKAGEAALAELGITADQLFDKQGKIRDFAGVFDLLSAKGANQAQLTALFADQWDAVSAIMRKGGGSIRTFGDELRNMDTEAEAKKLQTGLIFSLEQVRARLEKLGEKISQSGLIEFAEKLVQKGGALLTWLGELSPTTQKVLLVFGGILAVIGPLLSAIGFMASGWGALSAAVSFILPILGTVATFIFSTAIPAIVSMTAALLAFPGTWIVAAIVGVVAGIWWLVKNWDKVVEWFGNAWDWLVDKVKWWADMHVKAIMWLVDKAKALIPDWLLDLFSSDGETKVVTQEAAAAAAGGRTEIRETKESRVTVEFDGLPQGARLRAERGADVDLSLGYAMVAPG